MPKIHDIRLAGPWQQMLPEDREAARIQLPFAISSGTQTQISRRFHKPTGLSSSCRVHVVLNLTGQPAAIDLNDAALVFDTQSASSAENRELVSTDLAAQLQSFNELRLQATESEPFTLHSAVLRIVSAEPDDPESTATA